MNAPHFPASTMQQAWQTLPESIGRMIFGKDETIRLAISAVLANGHVLLEDLPGSGKTLLAQSLAQVLGLQLGRVQFTSDLLPADLTGGSIYDATRGEFRHQSGPIFCELLLADEINRASPRTQSALLEAMAERCVTQDGVTRPLPAPFLVLATQNPAEQHGTSPLPEAQLDRFLVCLSLGYPDREAELQALRAGDGHARLHSLAQMGDSEGLLLAQAEVASVTTGEPLLAYVQDLLQASRQHGHGLSTRAGLALLAMARAWAWLAGRDFVLPADVRKVFIPVCAHRLPGHAATRMAQARLVLDSVAVPA